MLQINKSRLVPEQATAASEFVSPAELYAAVAGFVRRQFRVIAFVLLLSLALGAAYLFTAPARYTAHAVLVIDTHKTQFSQQSPLGDLPIDSATIDTQIEILKSENIAQSVIKQLHLTEDPEFVSPPAGVIGTSIGIITSALTFSTPSLPRPGEGASSEFQLMRGALGTFQSKLSVARLGLTYAIAIDYQSFSPDRAAQVANAVADGYVVDELEAKYQTTRRAAAWLQDRLKELREESSKAERAVVDYKAKNNIVDTGGRLMNEQQLAELSSNLIQARAQTSEAKARLERVQQILSTDDLDPAGSAAATVTDTLHNEVITKLRQQYLDYSAKVSDWTTRYGASHLAVVNLRNQMRELRRSILDELRRIAETYKSDYEISKTREDSVQKSLDQIVSESQTTNEAQIVLHDLESSAQSYRALYDNFLQRYMESVQQQSFPISEARLITQAAPPQGKSAPRISLVLMLAGVGGLILGAGIGVLRDISDRVFRTTGQVEERLQADCISVVPLVKGGMSSVNDAPKTFRPPDPQVTELAPFADPAIISRDQSMLWTIVDSPFSRFAESIRAIKVATDLSNVVKANRVIGITSSLPNEGKSTIATALAELISHGGGRALLVDCDLRNPSLSRKLTPHATAGLLDLIAGKALPDEVVCTEPVTGLAFLPAVVHTRLAHTSEILASEATRQVFEKLREAYDYIIVDLSPLAPVVDVRAMTHLVDSFVFVVEWGRTKIDIAQHALGGARGVYENLLGIVLNKANMDTFGRYERYRGNYYYNRYYARYGYTD
jgi:succinoglycan biosynthesis transport protein ExoP